MAWAAIQYYLDAADVDLSTGREVLTELCELPARPNPPRLASDQRGYGPDGSLDLGPRVADRWW